MTDKSDKLDLDALEAMAGAATSGRWEVVIEGENLFVAGDGLVVADDCLHCNAKFIAASREAVPALVKRVRELEAIVALVESDAVEGNTKHFAALARIRELEEALSEARERLQHVSPIIRSRGMTSTADILDETIRRARSALNQTEGKE